MCTLTVTYYMRQFLIRCTQSRYLHWYNKEILEVQMIITAEWSTLGKYSLFQCPKNNGKRCSLSAEHYIVVPAVPVGPLFGPLFLRKKNIQTISIFGNLGCTNIRFVIRHNSALILFSFFFFRFGTIRYTAENL